MKIILDDEDFIESRIYLEDRFKRKWIFSFLKWFYLLIGIFVIVINLAFIITFSIYQFDLSKSPVEIIPSFAFALFSLFELISVLVALPLLVIIWLGNLFFKIFKPVQKSILVTSLGIALVLIAMFFFNNEMKWFLNLAEM